MAHPREVGTVLAVDMVAMLGRSIWVLRSSNRTSMTVSAQASGYTVQTLSLALSAHLHYQLNSALRSWQSTSETLLRYT